MKEIRENNKNAKFIADKINDMIDDFVLELQKVRISRGITQYKLAKLAGLSHTTIMRIENYSTTPSLTALLRIASALELSFMFCPKNDTNSIDENDPDSEEHIPEIDTLTVLPAQYISFVPTDVQNLTIPDYIVDNKKIIKSKILFDISKTMSFQVEASHYSDCIHKVLQAYLDTLQRYSIHKALIDGIERFTNSMILVMHEYYLGQHTSAYELFAETMNKIDIAYLFCDLLPTQRLYRARKFKMDKKKPLQKEDFYHIPFEKRTEVSSQRYSFPGLPCLYVGTTKEVCFQELDCDEANAAIAEIRLHGDVPCQVLDLTKIFDTQFDKMTYFEQTNFLRLFPLVFLCSTDIQQTSTPNKPKFRPDYVIPQLLLEYILDKTTWNETPIVGIKYFSVKNDFLGKWLNGETDALSAGVNIAIPARTDGEHGFCSTLKKIFYVDHIID